LHCMAAAVFAVHKHSLNKRYGYHTHEHWHMLSMLF